MCIRDRIRAIIGAQTISQGHGKVKSARISDDGTEYLIVLEDEDNESFYWQMYQAVATRATAKECFS